VENKEGGKFYLRVMDSELVGKFKFYLKKKLNWEIYLGVMV